MRIIVDGTGKVLTCGSESLVADDGQTAHDDDALNMEDFVAADQAVQASGSPGAVHYDAANHAFTTQPRAVTAAETTVAQLRQARANWSTLTATQKAEVGKGLLDFLVQRGLL